MRADIEMRGNAVLIAFANGKSIILHGDGSYSYDDGRAVRTLTEPINTCISAIVSVDYSTSDRVYKVDRNEAPTRPDNKMAPNNPNFPETGRQVVAILKRLGVVVQPFSQTQIKLLTTIPVPSRDSTAVYKAPEEERLAHLHQWDEWIDQIENSPVYKAWFVQKTKRPTISTVIDLIRAYEWKGGWLSVRDAKAFTYQEPAEWD